MTEMPHGNLVCDNLPEELEFVSVFSYKKTRQMQRNMYLIFYVFIFLPLCNKMVQSLELHKIQNQIGAFTRSKSFDFIPYVQSEATTPSMDNDFEQEIGPIHRMKRGIIWNKIKKVKSGIWSAKKKLWRIKEKAVEIMIGKDYATPKPYYQSTGGSWGDYQKPKRDAPLLSGTHGPPYAASNFKGVGWSKSNIWPKNRGSSTKLTYADLLSIYRLPLNMETVRKLQMINKSRL